ncbi:hypothetical protein RHGRI_002860 [Rhododendron griersonianum]|uniref:At1g61320/AtMIF1 LRR domain-containing protein n=1 Tax=Rhododendron griersonianum TaxID=479676 RepID=A0AAV6LSQ2_9ERIC|nr:hypothetical protein RHGRI_002860 [Rhododendron griersonianum]
MCPLAALYGSLSKRVSYLDERTDVSDSGNWNYPLTVEILHGYRLNSLTSLYLCHVDMTEEVHYYFLSVCPSLEELSVIDNKCLVNFSVSGPSLKLGHLEIQDKWNLEKLDVCDSNLVSFKYSGQKLLLVWVMLAL